MTFKRFIAVALSLLLLVGALPEMLPAALATPSADGCTKSSDGKHAWYPRPRDPWCEISGGLVYICSYCNKEAFEETTPALGHDWGAWKTITEASCTKEGLKARSCNRCGKRETENIGYAHQYGPWETDIPGTCVTKERAVRKCKICGYLDYWYKDYGDHDWGEWETVKAPTATEPGEEKRVCKNTPNHVETREIPATGAAEPEEEKPSLTLAWTAAKPSEPLAPDAHFYVPYCVTNTGNVTMDVVRHTEYENLFSETRDKTSSTWYEDFASLIPGKTIEMQDGYTPVSERITPDTETEDLLGTVNIRIWYTGHDPETGEELCTSNTLTRTWKVAKDGGPHPQLTLTASWADDAGVGKRYEDAEVEFVITQTNTGDCPLIDMSYANSKIISFIGPSGPIAPGVTYQLQPDESTVQVVRANVRPGDVDSGIYEYTWKTQGHYINDDGQKKEVYSNAVKISIPLTYADGEEPEEKKPELTTKWEYDVIVPKSFSMYSTTEPGVLSPTDTAIAVYYFINSGNVPLKIVDCVTYGDGFEESRTIATFSPGDCSILFDWGSYPVTTHMTPGTETEDLLGTTTINIFAIGCDPETGEELCRSNVITRTWQVGKDGGWEIPEDSKLEGRLEVRSGYESSDPAGYVLDEPVSTILYVKNTGLVDLDSFTVTDPWDGTTFTDGPIAVGEEKSYVRADTTVQPEDVEKGYIDYPAIQITWVDPDSEKERPTVAGPLHLTVLSKTGLLLKKGVAFEPENHEYFQVGEPIQWSLTVTNNSEEPVKNVTVEDKGKTVGSYAEIVPNDTKNCIVPVYIVTEYDAKVVGYVLNSATATGTDWRDATHTWPSNVAKAITMKKTTPDEDPKGDIDGLHPAATIVKEEDPHGPLNGKYYEANEKIDYIITVRNTGDTELKDVAVTDSLAGFAPIGTLASLKPGEEKQFTFSYTVKDTDLPYGWVYNSAVLSYTFGDNTPGTPKSSNTVQSKVGDEDLFPPELPHLDPEKIPEGDDWCSLTLDALADAEADYTLHACAEHTEVAMAAEEAAMSGDWAKAAELWKAEVEALYEVLYAAADSELKAALIAEQAAYYDHVDGLHALSDEAAVNELRIKCAFLCCALHTTPEDLPGSLAGDYAQMMGGEQQTESGRVIGALTGSDSEVKETYAGSIAYAQQNITALMDIEKSYDWDDVFERGIQLWQTALDATVNPIYKAADKDARKQIANWRISLDTLYNAEKEFMALLYEGNDEAIQETLMELYKAAALTAGNLK